MKIKATTCILMAALILCCMVSSVTAAEETKLTAQKTVTPKAISFEEFSELATAAEVKNMEKIIDVFEKYDVKYEIYDPESCSSEEYGELMELDDPAELEKLLSELTSGSKAAPGVTRATDNYYKEFTFRPNGTFHYNVSQTALGGIFMTRHANIPYAYAYYSNGTPYFSSLNTNSVTSWVTSPFLSYSQQVVHWNPSSNNTSGNARILGVLTLGTVVSGYPVGFTFDSDWQFKMTLTK
ncbi:MAG: hypothetical protein LBU81_05915 [Methanosarcinales archaeon]|jgi:hypothetical protein|nr:hypothetical protein [Methanosarcinales archaeon]